MHSGRYVHPEFGFLSPTPRLRRDLRTAFFSVLFGIGIGAAAVIALSGNNNGDDTRGPHGGRSASVISEEPTEVVLDENSPQPAGIEKSVNKDHTSKPNGSTAEANSENRKTNATTTCEGDNSVCRKVPPPAGKPSATQTPASVGTTSAAPSTSSEPASEHSAADRSEDRAGDPPQSKPLTHKKPSKTARNPNRLRQEAPNYREDRAASWTRPRLRPAGRGTRPRIFARSLIRPGRLLGLVPVIAPSRPKEGARVKRAAEGSLMRYLSAVVAPLGISATLLVGQAVAQVEPPAPPECPIKTAVENTVIARAWHEDVIKLAIWHSQKGKTQGPAIIDNQHVSQGQR